jgi:hypothetical protein
MSATTVILDATDAAELGEMLEFVHDWVGSDRPGVEESLRRFTAGGYTLAELRADLARFAFLLGGDGDRFVDGTDR